MSEFDRQKWKAPAGLRTPTVPGKMTKDSNPAERDDLVIASTRAQLSFISATVFGRRPSFEELKRALELVEIGAPYPSGVVQDFLWHWNAMSSLKKLGPDNMSRLLYLFVKYAPEHINLKIVLDSLSRRQTDWGEIADMLGAPETSRLETEDARAQAFRERRPFVSCARFQDALRGSNTGLLGGEVALQMAGTRHLYVQSTISQAGDAWSNFARRNNLETQVRAGTLSFWHRQHSEHRFAVTGESEDDLYRQACLRMQFEMTNSTQALWRWNALSYPAPVVLLRTVT